MIRFLEPYRGERTTIHRLPGEVKLAGTLLIILPTVLLPWTARSLPWLGFAALVLFALAWASRIPAAFIVRRMLLLMPFVVGVTVVNAFHPAYHSEWPWLLARGGICLLAVIILSNTTLLTEVLRVLRRLRVPALLVTTIALMHRYLFVMAEEAERMRRARASRTFTAARRRQWPILASVLSQLFIRASARAERIYDAMCARGLR